MDRIPLEEIKRAADIVEVAETYIPLVKSGSTFMARCPFHSEKTPSFHISSDRGRYKCFGCGKSGDVISFVQEIDHLTFVEAATLLARRYGVALQENTDPLAYKRGKILDFQEFAKRNYIAELKKEVSVVSYLTSRGVEPKTIEQFGIGFAPDNWNTVSSTNKFTREVMTESGTAVAGTKGVYDRFRSRLMFPLCDGQGRVVGFSGRLLRFPNKELKTEKETSGKYVNSPESLVYHKSEVLFGLHLAKSSAVKNKRMIVVEGQFDCVLAHQAGTTETVALSGTALTNKQVALIARYCDTVILALDGDSAGIGALTRSVKELFAQDIAVKVCVLPDKQDPADVIKQNPEDWLKLVSEAKDYLQVRLELLDRQFETQKEKDKAIREEVYPLVFQIENPLTLDRALQLIAKTLNVQFETILKDYEMTTANFVKNSEQKSTQEVSKEDSLEFLRLKYLEYIEQR